MAAAVRVEADNSTRSERGGTAHAVGLGPFGIAVARRLAGLHACAGITEVTPPARLRAGDLPFASAYVLASWRPETSTFRYFDECCRGWGSAWLPVVAEPPVLRVGPVIVPGVGCYRCWNARSLQHSPTAELTVALHDHLDTHPDEGPGGYLESHSALAAGVAARVLSELANRPADAAGQVWQLHVTTLRAQVGSVVPVNGCPSCSSSLADRNLADALEEVLS